MSPIFIADRIGSGIARFFMGAALVLTLVALSLLTVGLLR